MTTADYNDNQTEGGLRDRNLASIMDTAGLGLFLIWVGIAFWLDLVGWGLIGAGVITLGDQAVRRFLRIKVEGNWVFVGVLLVCSGFRKIQTEFPLVPLLLILAGVALLISLVRWKAK
ncbi:hypothetical protein OAM01_02120 [bacterium]|nr:hypothetical protein [bacterium]